MGLAAIIFAGPAAAAPTTNSQSVSVASAEADLGGFQLQAPLVFADPFPIVLTDLTVSAKATWTGDITTDLAWDSDKVRQGADLAVSRVASASDGTLAVHWLLSGEFDGVSFSDFQIDEDNISCDPKYGGAGFECEADSPGLTLPVAPLPSVIPGTWVLPKVGINVTFDVTPTGAVVTRGLSMGGNNVAGPDGLSLTDSSQSETLSMPCTGKAGDSVAYKLDPFHWTPAAKATEQIEIRIVNTVDPVGAIEMFDWAKKGVGSEIVSNPAFDLTGTGFTTSMGSLLGNNISPTIGPLAQFSGTEGSPIALSASASSQCPISSYVWEFSNGTKSYGPSPQRAFADNGVYDGQLTVTDVTGLSATKNFTVTVANAKPSVNAGPDTTADWGRPVQFNGQATDPGSDDQATLQYTWTFGDGSPSATGGPSAIHSYSAPGDYVATLNVCDKDGACDSSTRTIHVTPRETTLGYTGPLSGNPSKAINLTATLIDEYGQPVVGKKVTFVIGAQTATGTTDATGNASVSIKLNQKQGSYAFSASFPAGDAKYQTSSDSGTFVIGK
jgi:hypothetical protein